MSLEGIVNDYGDVQGEARACRERCALFDFSFIARGRVSGRGALPALHRYQQRCLADLRPGQIRYLLRTDRGGGVAADLTVWCLADGVYEVMSGRRVDIAELGLLEKEDTRVQDLSAHTAVFALQGPDALLALDGLTDLSRLSRLRYFTHDVFELAGIPCRIGRLGYTGEKGFEMVLDSRLGEDLWGILAARARRAGFAAADCLRIEAGFILFTNECQLSATATELGLEQFSPARAKPARMRLVCFKAHCANPPVLWQPCAADLQLPRTGRITVTSACHSVVRNCTIGLGFVHPRDADSGQTLGAPAQEFEDLELIGRPVHDPRKRRPRGPWPHTVPP